MRTPLLRVLAVAVVSLATAAPARADRLCDPAAEDCRAQLLDLIRAETVGIDVAFWFMEDARYSAELIRRAQAGVPVRVLIDTTALGTVPVRAQIIANLQNAGIPIRRRNASTILHWKMMLFAGQGQVEFSGANYSPDALLPTDPYRNYVDEAVFFTGDPALVHSFMQRYDDLWSDTTSYADYANVASRARHYPSYPIAAELNFPPMASYVNRALAGYAAERSGIDTIMYRITDRVHTDAMIAAVQRGVRVRLITEQVEYRNRARLWDSWNVDRLWMAGIEVRQRAHAGLNHQKSVILRGQNAIIFGSSNWTSPSNQEEHNMFTTRAWMVQWFEAQFDRKWNNTVAVETQSFQPLPPDAPVYGSPANGVSGVSVTPTITFNAGPFAHLYDIYLGTSPTPQLIAVDVPLGPSANGGMFSYQLPALAPGTRYYWRVVAKTMALQPSAGEVWSFVTSGKPGPAPGPLPSPSPTPTPDPGPAPAPAPSPSPAPSPAPAPAPAPQPPAPPPPPVAPRPVMSIDLPQEGQSVRPPFVLTGWAADLAAADNGIDVVHAYAYPATGAPPIFIGAVPVNGARPDVGGVFGAAHTPSGYGMFVRGLAPGVYTLVVYVHSSRGAGFIAAQPRAVRVEPAATLVLDVPINNAVVGQHFFISGWAADFGAATGNGIDLVHVYGWPLDGQAAGPIFFGQAPVYAPRPDVGLTYGSQFGSGSGWGILAPVIPPGRYQVVVYGRSLVAGTFATAAAAIVTVR